MTELTNVQAGEKLLEWFTDESRWCKNYNRLCGDDGETIVAACIGGGIGMATHGMMANPLEWGWGDKSSDSLLSRTLVDVAREQFPERMNPHASIVKFNDHPRTTFEDVQLVIGKTIVRLRELEG